MPDRSINLQYVDNELQRFGRLRRSVFVFSGVVGCLLIIFNTIQLSMEEADSQFHNIFIVNNIMLCIFTAIVVLLSAVERANQDKLERWTLVIFAIESLLFNGIAPALVDLSYTNLFTETISDDIWFLLIICMGILHLFPLRKAFWLTAGLYAVSTGIVLYRVWAGTPPGDSRLGEQVMHIYMFGAVLLAFFFLLARFRENLSQLTLQHRLLEQLAYTDSLTELPNRRYVTHVIEEQIELAIRYHHPFCVLLCDIDHFKLINDQFGHMAGDEVLVTVAQLLKSAIRSTDLVGRWGGEEFLVVMRMTELEDASMVAERIRLLIANTAILNQHTATISIGGTNYVVHDTLESLIKRADQALYQVKFSGRNRVQFVSADTSHPYPNTNTASFDNPGRMA